MQELTHALSCCKIHTLRKPSVLALHFFRASDLLQKSTATIHIPASLETFVPLHLPQTAAGTTSFLKWCFNPALDEG